MALSLRGAAARGPRAGFFDSPLDVAPVVPPDGPLHLGVQRHVALVVGCSDGLSAFSDELTCFVGDRRRRRISYLDHPHGSVTIQDGLKHQNPGFRSPHRARPAPDARPYNTSRRTTDSQEPSGSRPVGGVKLGRAQRGWPALAASIQSSRSAGATSIRVVNQINITRQCQVP